MHRIGSILAALTLTIACASAPQEAPRTEPTPSGPPIPAGPTRTEAKVTAKKLVGRCATGGWIEEWRLQGNEGKPRIYLSGFADKTGEDIDTSYLTVQVQKRMRLAGFLEVVADAQSADFVADGVLQALAERTRSGRIRIYNASLSFRESGSGRTVCVSEYDFTP